MVFVDLCRVSALTLAGLSALLVAGGAMVEANRQGLDPAQLLALLPYLLPPTLPFTMPVSLLFACTVVYGRMSGASEIIAVKASGVNALRLLWPAGFLAILFAGAGIVLSDGFIPRCHRAVAKTILADLQNSLLNIIEQHGGLFEPDVPYEIYVRGVHGCRLVDPILKHRGPTGKNEVVVQASAATLRVVPAEESTSGETAIQLRMEHGVASTLDGSLLHFNQRSQEAPLPDSSKRDGEKINTLDFAGCLKRADRRRDESAAFDADLATQWTGAVFSGDLENFLGESERNRAQARRADRKAREANAEVHLRIAQAAVVIPFILLGCPISILFRRRDFLQTFFICFAPIVLIYYPVVVFSHNLVKEGAVNPWLSLWVPPLLMMVAAVPFLLRVRRY